MKRTFAKICAVALTAILLAMPVVCSAAELTDEAYIYYNFENGGKDSGTAGADAVSVGVPVTKSKAANENGPGGKYLVVDAENFFKISKEYLQFGNENFSLSCWMKFPSDTPDGTFMRLFQTGYWADNSPGFVIAATRNGDQASFANGIAVEKGTDADGTWGFYSLCDNYYDDQWHHFVFAFDQEFGEYAIYLDGEKVLTRIVGVKETLKSNASWDLALGFLSLDGKTGMALVDIQTGLEMGIDEFAIYNKFLSEEEVASYYASSKNAPAPVVEVVDEDPVDTDPIDAPQTGFATAIVIAGAVFSGAYIVRKKH